MANSRARRQPASVRNTSSVDLEQGTRLRLELARVLPDTPRDLTERIARTAHLSRREAHRILDDSAQAADVALTTVQAAEARRVIDRMAGAA